MPLTTIKQALKDIRAGKIVIVVDDEDRENEGDLIAAAEKVTPELINFMSRFGRGLICAPLKDHYFRHLKIPMMVPDHYNTAKFSTGFGVSVGARHNVTTGISAHDRAETVRVLVDPKSTPEDISMPGHIFPLRARDNGVLERRGHTEAAVDLARLAGLAEAGVICEVMNEDGTMARLPQLEEFAETHGLNIISIADLVAYRHQREKIVERIECATIPTPYGKFKTYVFRDHLGMEHLALCLGQIGPEPAYVRMHSECLTGDVLGSLRCDCGNQLKLAMQKLQRHGSGILLYLRQEGRGIGLANKIKAYALQEKGLDTVEANRCLGFPDDARTYDVGAAMLKDLGIDKVFLMTNNPAKVQELRECGVKVVRRIPHRAGQNKENEPYLKTKAAKMGHLIRVMSPEEIAEEEITSTLGNVWGPVT